MAAESILPSVRRFGKSSGRRRVDKVRDPFPAELSIS
jgi:hypothetical protein